VRIDPIALDVQVLSDGGGIYETRARGISNNGTTVSVSSVLPGETKLDSAMQELKVGGTMQSLGTRVALVGSC
jgi:hypothetical protein